MVHLALILTPHTGECPHQGQEAAKLLETKITSLIRYTNLINYSIYSPALDKEVFIIYASKPRTKNNPQYSNTNHLEPISGINLEALVIGLLYAYHSDKVTLFGIFDNPAKAALNLDNKKDSKYINRYINKERLVEVGAAKAGTPGYFCNALYMYKDKIGPPVAKLVI